jgi:hypothetical protein
LHKLPGGDRPARIVARLNDGHPAPPSGRRRRLAALRQPWPYRRFRLAATTPAWLWDAIHLGGMVDADGSLQLDLPPGWATAAGAELLWGALRERLSLTKLQLHADGRQTLMFVGQQHAGTTLEFCHPDGTCRQVPYHADDAGVAAIAALTGNTAGLQERPARLQHRHAILAETVAAKVFRDGLPDFPGQYLRRLDRMPLRRYRLPGPLQADSPFFDRVGLYGPDGSLVTAAHPADAEALLLASYNGRTFVELPTEPAVTARLVGDYRRDLQRLWQELLDECRRHQATQRGALRLARRLWRERRLPPLAGPPRESGVRTKEPTDSP